MQNDIILNESEYIEGFNIGYRMTKEFPEFSEFLAYASGQNDKLEGMKDGRSQYLEEELEKTKNKTLTKDNLAETKRQLPWLDKTTSKQKNVSLDKDKGLEPDF